MKRAPKTTDPWFGCGRPCNLLRNCRKTKRDKIIQKPLNTNITNPCETCGKMSRETKDCYSGANWANRSTWWKTPKSTGSNSIPLQQQAAKKPYNSHKSISSQKPWHNKLPSQNLRKPHLQFADDADFRYYTTSEPSQNFDKEMLMEYSGKPSTNWQRRWLFRRLIKIKKNTLDKLPYPDWYIQNPPTHYNTTRRPLLPSSVLETYI